MCHDASLERVLAAAEAEDGRVQNGGSVSETVASCSAADILLDRKRNFC